MTNLKPDHIPYKDAQLWDSGEYAVGQNYLMLIARINELEAENARLRETLTFIHNLARNGFPVLGFDEAHCNTVALKTIEVRAARVLGYDVEVSE